jgi:hypothetical protein
LSVRESKWAIIIRAHTHTHSTDTAKRKSLGEYWILGRRRRRRRRRKVEEWSSMWGDWQLHWCVDKARLRCSSLFLPSSSSRQRRSWGGYFSLSLFCLFVYPPASAQSFVLFNGRLFSHLYRYTYVYVCTTISYSGLFPFSVCVCPVVLYSCVWKLREGQTVSYYSANQRFFYSLSLSYRALSLCSGYPARIGWHLVLFRCVCLCARGYVYIYTEHFFIIIILSFIL